MAETCVIGLLGSSLDSGSGQKRWQRWRPSVNVCQHDDLQVDRFELLIDPRHKRLAKTIRKDIEIISPGCIVNLHEIPFQDPWDFSEVYGHLHDFARNYSFDQDTDYLVHISTGTHVAQICMFLLCESRHLPGRLLQTAPAKRGDTPIPDSYAIIDLDLSKYDHLAERFAQERYEGIDVLKRGIQTNNAAFNNLMEEIELVAASSYAPMLLNGETGVGKTQLARRIYELKCQRHLVSGALVEVNCATLRGDQAMSMLFGHTKGAFTGALHKREGLLKQADNGLLFLDEIGELGLDEQAMLLRAVEEKIYLPVGSDKPIMSDFQLIAGTNRDLNQAVANGTFREDLLARINLWTFTLPALRERPEDIEPNIAYELNAFAEEYERQVQFNKEAQNMFMKYAQTAPWPGNFRDFNAAITRMATLSQSGRIGTDQVRAEIQRQSKQWQGQQKSAPANSDLVQEILGAASTEVDPFDYIQLNEVLRICRSTHSRAEAGRQLFAVSRLKKKTNNDSDRLAKYLDRFDISWEQITRS